MHFLIYHRRCVSRFRQISREISCVKTIINLAASGGYKLLKFGQATFVWTPAPDCVYLDKGAHLACELRALHGVPHLVRQPLRVLAGGGVVVQPALHHPVPATSRLLCTKNYHKIYLSLNNFVEEVLVKVQWLIVYTCLLYNAFTNLIGNWSEIKISTPGSNLESRQGIEKCL